MKPTPRSSRAAARGTDPPGDIKAELRALRKRLADAWWYEESLDKIEGLEARINHCLSLIRKQS
jgi:hypothetical protein